MENFELPEQDCTQGVEEIPAPWPTPLQNQT